MARAFTNRSFTIDHVSWFKDNFGYMPTQSELELLIRNDPGVADLLLGVFSEKYYLRNIKNKELI